MRDKETWGRLEQLELDLHNKGWTLDRRIDEVKRRIEALTTDAAQGTELQLRIRATHREHHEHCEGCKFFLNKPGTEMLCRRIVHSSRARGKAYLFDPRKDNKKGQCKHREEENPSDRENLERQSGVGPTEGFVPRDS